MAAGKGATGSFSSDCLGSDGHFSIGVFLDEPWLPAGSVRNCSCLYEMQVCYQEDHNPFRASVENSAWMNTLQPSTKRVVFLSGMSLRRSLLGAQGTHATKTRAQVRGGGRKPVKQKGTGSARKGSIRAPHVSLLPVSPCPLSAHRSSLVHR